MQLLFFHGRYCPSCQTAQKRAEKYAKDSGIPLYAFDVSDVYGGHSMAKMHRVRHVPCLILLDDDGQEKGRIDWDFGHIEFALDPTTKGGAVDA